MTLRLMKNYLQQDLVMRVQRDARFYVAKRSSRSGNQNENLKENLCVLKKKMEISYILIFSNHSFTKIFVNRAKI